MKISKKLFVLAHEATVCKGSGLVTGCLENSTFQHEGGTESRHHRTACKSLSHFKLISACVQNDVTLQDVWMLKSNIST